MKVLSYGKGMKITGIICALILLFFSVAIFFIPNKDSDILYYILIPFSVIFFPLSILGIRDVLISKVILSKNSINSITAISDRILRIEEIRGFKRGRNYIHVYPKKRVFKKKLKFSMYLKNTYEIVDWLLENSKDLDVIEEENEIDDFYKNTSLGFTDTEKEACLNKAKKIAKIINITSITLTILAIFFKEYAMISAWILIGIPLLIITIVFFFKGLIKFVDKEEDEFTIYPNVFWGFSVPIFLAFLLILTTIDIYDYSNFWVPFSITAVTIFTICIIASKEYIIKNKKSYGKLISLLFVVLAYGYLIIMFLNVTLDTSTMVSYKAILMEKDKSTGKSASYYFYLKIPEMIERQERFTVSKSTFDKSKVEDSVLFMLKKGRLKIPYYNIRVKD